MEKDIRSWPWLPSGYTAYPLPSEQISGIFACEPEEGSDTLEIHIANSCMPESPFHDVRARALDLQSLLETATTRDPGLRTIGCNSWLNAFPPFLRLFPPEWPREEEIAPLGYSFNWWGQMMARDGRFHERSGQHMRTSGEFPYPSVEGHCEIDSLRMHLHRFLEAGP